MRLHSLELTAFGPYAGTETVDFDALNEAGVFLLTGPTGAGKTSILDAVCYALYAVVPGDREVRGLRSDHAPVGRRPQVTLELTLGGRRLRVVRSPEWRRPKQRGEGTTKEPASARLFEIDPDGTERLVSDRAQEVGHELGPLLGMSSDQFMQVVLLPQSGFQTFLKAGSDQRRDVLEQLFATERFSRIEDWMHDRARVVRGRAQESLDGVRTLLAVLRDRAATPLPDDLAARAAGSAGGLLPTDAPRLVTWADGLVAASEQRLADLEVAVADTAGAAEEADSEAARVRARDLLLRRRAGALRDRDALEETRLAAAEQAAALDADRRAQPVAPLLARLRRATDQAQVSAIAVRTAADLLDDPSALDDPAALLEQLVTDEQRLRALRPRADDLRRHSAEETETAVGLAAAEATLATLADQRRALPVERAGLDKELAAVTGRALRLETALTRHDEAAARLEAARSESRLQPLLATAESAERAAHEHANTTRGAALDVVALRLAGIAAELAGALEEGAACQVCGSTDHPAPAVAGAAAVTEADQAAAQQVADDALATLERRRRAADELRARVAEARALAAGHDPVAAQAALAEADLAVHDAREAETERRGLVQRVADLTRRLESTTAAHDSAAAEVADLRARLRAARDAGLAAAAAIRDALGHEATEVEALTPVDAEALVDGLEEQIATLSGRSSRVRALVEATATAARDASALHEATAEALTAATAAGFEGLDEARTALLPADRRAAWSRAHQERQEALARVEVVLADPEVAALDVADGSDGSDGPDPGQADLVARAARQAHAQAVAQHEHAGLQLAALRAQADQLGSAVATWAPAQVEADTVGELASLVRGGGDNRLHMRLSSYVLATRLDQVLDAANGRLAQMRDTRYLLERTDRARRANAQAGLDLQVLDEWTGEVRPPSSLSGGECFVVSLALALGLADVIGEETGGVEVDTLFIDEGFGSLDPETLDQVMDRIDDLRSGGRAVGVVSHVGELRSRITTQVHVQPGRTGSRIAIAHGDA